MKNEKKGLFSLMSRIDGMSNQFTKTDWKIVQFIKTAPQEFLTGSAQSLAAKINVSDASIVRFAQKVGFSGLSELKYTLQNELEKESTIISHNSYTLLMQDYNILIEALFKLIKPDHIDILRKQLLAAKRIYIVGLDQNRNVAELVKRTNCTLLGMDVQAITTRDALNSAPVLPLKKNFLLLLHFPGTDTLLQRRLEKSFRMTVLLRLSPTTKNRYVPLMQILFS